MKMIIRFRPIRHSSNSRPSHRSAAAQPRPALEDRLAPVLRDRRPPHAAASALSALARPASRDPSPATLATVRLDLSFAGAGFVGDGAAAVDHRKCAADLMDSAADMTVVSAADTMVVSAADMTGSVVDPIISVEAVTTTFAEWMADSADVAGADAADSAKVEITDPISYLENSL